VRVAISSTSNRIKCENCKKFVKCEITLHNIILNLEVEYHPRAIYHLLKTGDSISKRFDIAEDIYIGGIVARDMSGDIF
ncbi:MAG: hypothetical protein ILA13_01935, partial [Eubacterium sp.]|nr:hypothetical protein [Eubacterium sp.]